MKAEITKVHKDGSFNLEVTCEHCGLRITRSSAKWGMDCKNRCSEKALKKQMKTDPITKEWVGIMHELSSGKSEHGNAVDKMLKFLEVNK